MITEDYISYNSAVLLQKKGFKGDYHAWYNKFAPSEVEFNNSIIPDNFIPAPTLQMAMKWVNEEHGIYIEIRRNLNVYTFKYLIQNNGKLVSYSDWMYTTHEEACEVAIKYCLENLI